jgi:uncharacterized protein YyaL (SSP411 family)
MHTNRLAHEKSPYLLQHAQNPVDWYPWGPEAFDKAKSEDKPIFLSIGYSTCHWCHVMERESFESEEIAQVLNRFFVPIKVDREERPDVDRIYMMFVQASTGGGGWPMSVWLTPDLKPFFGGTYFPPDSRWGRPGFRQVLEQLAMAWQTDRTRIMESGRDVVQQLEQHLRTEGSGWLDEGVLDSAFYGFRRTFDIRLGGFGGAPKFPRAVAYNFLLRYGRFKREAEASQMVLHTLREMAKGGMMDQLGGGVHRYSVDARWFVPHFEKMLYDQAQLATSYLEGYQVSRDDTLAQTARGIFEYVLRDMTAPEGGFYSAEDADSVIDPQHPQEKGEGAFYIWTYDELQALLGCPQADWFCHRFGVEPEGNVADDPHDEFRGKNILHKRHSMEETAARFDVSVPDLSRAIDDATTILMRARAQRVRPHLDDKILTAWNGLMIGAFATGARVLNEPRYLEAAQRAARFILEHLYIDGSLLRRWREGEAAIGAFLDDYAFFSAGLLDLYEADFDGNWLIVAQQLTDKMRQLFEDTNEGGFFSTGEADTALVLRMKEDYDGAEPSGNSIAILNLLRLARITGQDDYSEAAARALRAFAPKLRTAPSGMPQMLVAYQYSLQPPRQIVLAGSQDGLSPFLAEVRMRFLPEYTLLWSGSAGLHVPGLKDKRPVDGRAAAYVCQNFACQLPATEASQFAELLQ